MPCNSPLTAYKAPGGKITFKQRDGYYDLPLKIACGQCRGCRLRRTRDWAIRAVHEGQMHDKNSFVTLTYDNEHLPHDQTLVVKHWQDFAKRLRKKMGPFRFLHCGEYTDNHRPHYHACIFGQNFQHDRVELGNQEGHKLHVSPTLQKLWPYGFHSIGELTFDSAAYVAAYCFKKLNGQTAKQKYTRTDTETGETWSVRPEYATMSRRPGLGSKWFDKYKGDLYPHDFAVAKGQKFRPPKYYDQLLKEKDPELWDKMQNRRIQHIKKHPEDQTHTQQIARETIIQAKSELHQTRLIHKDKKCSGN